MSGHLRRVLLFTEITLNFVPPSEHPVLLVTRHLLLFYAAGVHIKHNDCLWCFTNMAFKVSDPRKNL